MGYGRNPGRSPEAEVVDQTFEETAKRGSAINPSFVI